MRRDLVALGEDELVALTNRGTVRRAVKEVASVAVEERGDGTVVATGRDGVIATLAPGVPVDRARCTCAAVVLCRHVVRAVLAYRAWVDAGAAVPDAAVPDAAVPDAARPDAAVPDAARSGPSGDLLAALPARVRAAGERLVEAGATATVVRSAAPVVLLHETGTTVRFLVPDDLAHARCDCRDAPPCAHVVPAVRALRAAGPVVELHRRAPDTRALHGLDTALALLAEAGAASGRDAVRAALDAASVACRGAALTWPADVLAELADLCARHAVADSGFDPLFLAQLAGEAVLRADTLRHVHSPVPTAFAGGWSTAAETEVVGGRLIGLGTRVRQAGRVVDVDALTYDAAARRVVALGRTSVDPAPDDGTPCPSYADLAAATLQKGITVAAAGAGQLVATGGRRTPAGRLRLGRRPAALGPQRFDWTGALGPPVLVEGAAEAAGVVSATFPAPLGPRSVGTGIVVVPVLAVADAGFDPAAQSVTATLVTPDGGAIALVHPYTSRAAGGAEALLDGLTAGTVRFVAGAASARGSATVVRPCGVVVEDAAGARRLVAPWTDTSPRTATAAPRPVPSPPPSSSRPRDLTVADHVLDLQAETGALLTTGVARADRTVRAAWAHLAEHADALGSTVLAPRVEAVAAALGARAADPGWTSTAAAAALLRLAAALELARALTATTPVADTAPTTTSGPADRVVAPPHPVRTGDRVGPHSGDAATP